jgi:hypothetical protein
MPSARPRSFVALWSPTSWRKLGREMMALASVNACVPRVSLIEFAVGHREA